MSKSNYEQQESDTQKLNRVPEEETATSEASIGLVATGERSESIASSILRAQRYGHKVFVTYTTDSENEGIKFARQLGTTIVSPPRDGAADHETLRQRLAGAAEVSDCRGLIFVSTPERRIDFERSVAELDGQTVCEAVYETETGEPDGVTIGIPAYNEGETIASVVTEAADFADMVLVVDDGSDDETCELAREAGATVVEHDVNQGYGAALQTLFCEAYQRDVEHLAIIDADGQHDPSDVPKMVERQDQENVELVIGSRFVDEGESDAPLYRRFGLSIINVLTNLSMGVIRPSSAVSDTQCGFRVYNQDAIASLADDETLGEGMTASTDILYHAHSNGFSIDEVGTHVSYDVENASSHNPFSHGVTLVSNILKTIEKERPVLVLGLPGFLSTLAGTYFGYLSVINYINTGTFPTGLALTSAIFGLAGIFAVFTSIILHSLDQHLRNDT